MFRPDPELAASVATSGRSPSSTLGISSRSASSLFAIFLVPPHLRVAKPFRFESFRPTIDVLWNQDFDHFVPSSTSHHHLIPITTAKYAPPGTTPSGIRQSHLSNSFATSKAVSYPRPQPPPPIIPSNQVLSIGVSSMTDRPSPPFIIALSTPFPANRQCPKTLACDWLVTFSGKSILPQSIRAQTLPPRPLCHHR